MEPTKNKEIIKIFVSHRIDLESKAIDNPLYINVRCGAFYDKRKNVDMIGDDTGDNISEKRLSFCELTVQYWAWKNEIADYYGLCHYRRYLSFSDNLYDNIDENNHIIAENIDEDFTDKYELSEEKMTKIIKENDIITLVPLYLNKLHDRPSVTVYESLLNNPAVFKIEIVDKFIEIVKRKYPDLAIDVDNYFSGYTWRAFNCYILKKDYFFEYNEMLFDVLFELDESIDKNSLNQEQLRIVGYMGEALFGIYYDHVIRCQDNIKTKELQLVKINNTQKTNVIIPAFKEKNVPIVMSCSEEYVPFLAVLLESIKSNASKDFKYDVIVLTQDMKARSKGVLINAYRDETYFSIRFFDANSYLVNRNLHTSMHITLMTYLRLAMPDFLKNYGKAIYLDCDVVINDDISKLYNINMEGNIIAAVRDTVMAGWSNIGLDSENEHVKYNYDTVGIENKFDYFNAGIILVDLNELRKEKTSSELFDLACSQKWKWFDQDVLNRVCKNRVLFLENEWNVMAHYHENNNDLSEFYAPYEIYMKYCDALNNPKAVHYAGRFIPCFVPKVDCADIFWKYAKKTPYYELILSIMMNNLISNTMDIRSNRGSNDEIKVPLYRKIAKKYCPEGSLRRKIFNLIIPPNSYRRRLCRNAYYLMRIK